MSRIEEFLNKGKLKKMTISSDMVIKELRIGERDIESSKQSYEIKNYKWATIQAYYGIYHATRALLFKSGYREESHAALKFAFKELFIDTKILEESIYRTLERGMDLRELADYKETFSENGANQLIENASVAITKISQYLNIEIE